MNDRFPVEVLLVEDNPGDARLIEEELASAGADRFELNWVERLKDGLNELDEDDTDLVLLDLSLPDSDGLDTVERVLEATKLPTVVLTGYEDENLGVQAVRAGVDDYLVKDDVDGDRLARAIRYALERHETQRQLEQLRRQVSMNEKLASLGALVAGVGKEIRNSTTHITNAIYQLRQRVEDRAREHPELEDLAEQIDEDAATAMDGVAQIDKLVRGLREFTQSGPEVRTRESLHEVVGEAVELFRRTHESTVTVAAELEPTAEVEINRTQIQQVVLNLLTNAAEAMPEGDEVRVSTVTDDEDRAKLVVEDAGKGMPTYVQERLFEPFFTTKDDHAGLGLAIARRIVDSHDGEIACTSRQGEGTRFTVHLPSAEEA